MQPPPASTKTTIAQVAPSSHPLPLVEYEVRERERLSSKNGGWRRRRRRRGGGELRRQRRRRPLRVRRGAQEEARPVLRRRREIHGWTWHNHDIDHCIQWFHKTSSYEAKSQESLLGYPNSQASDTSQLISQASFDGDIDGAGLVTNSNVIEDDDFQGKPANSGTSKELSDDDGDLEETTDPANANKMRRMLSNRESARRSRKRKQAHLNDLESQVSRLTSENASLLKRLADMTQKYKDASLDNKNLTVDIETMRRKVNIAEEAVRRLTGTTLMLSTAFDKPASSTPLSSCASDAASASVAIEDSMKHFLQAPLQSGQMKLDIPNAAIPLTSMVIGTKPASLQRVASLENLQKRIIGDSMHSETASTFSGPEAFADR
ncbi:bZIP transcription factor RISBZ2-like isoform X1 [Miscanthus floridulus]|uniref:bZIP transcription factor RISBZ2-like isoform X1 n=1 Tax=Miscanthus floridulus TaxID=154761 RepID=UPI00345763EB